MVKPILTAECGNNHEGNINTALKMIEVAKECRVTLIKFQAGTAKYFARQTTDIERYKKYELGVEGYRELIKKGQDVGIPVFFSVWDKEEGEYKEFRELEYYKIPSRQCNKETIQRYQREKTFISIPHTKTDIQSLEITTGIPMHCVAEYPANTPMLWRMQFLSRVIKLNIGYSDHMIGILNCVMAARYGACAIEKHFTLDKNTNGLRDHKLSADPKELRELASLIT